MGKHEGVPRGRKNNKQDSPEHRRRVKRRRIWLSGLASAVLAGVLATSLSGVLSGAAHAFEQAVSPSSSRGGHTPQGENSGAPRASKTSAKPTPDDHGHSPICQLKMSSEYPLDSWAVRAWMFPAGFAASPSQIAQINKDRTADLVNRDLYDDGGYALSTDTQLILRNDCGQPVTISDIRAEKSCRPPLSGTIFTGQSKLGEPSSADDEGTQLGFDLDSPNPEAMVAADWNVRQWTQEYASGSLVTIPGRGMHVFDIRAIALHSACRFSILVRAVYGGRPSTVTLNDDGQPFRVSALLPSVLGHQKPGGNPYAGYEMLYVGGDASPWHDRTWARENPKTWQLASFTHALCPGGAGANRTVGSGPGWSREMWRQRWRAASTGTASAA